MKTVKRTCMTTAALILALSFGAAQAGERLGGGAPFATASPEAVSSAALLDALKIKSLLQVVATEGSRHGQSLEGSLFPDRGGASWGQTVAKIQAPERLEPVIGDSLFHMLSATEQAEVSRFFTSDLGQRILEREVSARRAMLDKATEQDAQAAAASLYRAKAPRTQLIAALIESLDLIETNVTSGMNANVAFYRGLSDGGAMSRRLGETDILSMVQGQEDDIRSATRDWIRGYLMLAYAPLSDRELSDYLAFVKSDAGRRYNAAMFDGFGRLFEVTSYDLGRAAADYMTRTDI